MQKSCIHLTGDKPKSGHCAVKRNHPRCENFNFHRPEYFNKCHWKNIPECQLEMAYQQRLETL